MTAQTHTATVNPDVVQAFLAMRGGFDRTGTHPVRRVAAQVLRPLLLVR